MVGILVCCWYCAWIYIYIFEYEIIYGDTCSNKLCITKGEYFCTLSVSTRGKAYPIMSLKIFSGVPWTTGLPGKRCLRRWVTFTSTHMVLLMPGSMYHHMWIMAGIINQQDIFQRGNCMLLTPSVIGCMFDISCKYFYSMFLRPFCVGQYNIYTTTVKLVSHNRGWQWYPRCLILSIKTCLKFILWIDEKYQAWGLRCGDAWVANEVDGQVRRWYVVYTK